MGSLVPGHATHDATAAFAERADAARGHYRRRRALTLSSIGIGTYMGDATDAHDALVQAAVERALAAGVNVVDTALEYRDMRSERCVGRALRARLTEDADTRESVFVSTKAGWLTPDGSAERSRVEDVRARWLDSGVLDESDVSLGYHALPGFPEPEGFVNLHAMTPAFLDASLETSRRNLGLDTVDLMYVHNPECELLDTPRDVVMTRLADAFAFLERAVQDGRLRAFGVSTWFAFRTAPDDPQHLEMADLVRLAEDAANGRDHHFHAVQLPLSPLAPHALVARTQTVDGARVTPLDAARRLGLTVFTNASAGQGELARDPPPALAKAFPNIPSATARGLQWTRSVPGVTSALVGMKTPAHVAENLALVRVPPAQGDVVRVLVPDAVPPDAVPDLSG